MSAHRRGDPPPPEPSPTPRLTRIAAVEVPPEADAAFVADRRERSSLHRALRRDVALRFVELGEPEAEHAPAAFPAHAGLYEVVGEEGEPEGAGGVLLISFLEVPAGEDDRLLASRRRVREAWADRRGYLGTRLYRSPADADFRVVEITRWSSPLMYARALREPEVVDALAPSFRAHAALYLPV